MLRNLGILLTISFLAILLGKLLKNSDNKDKVMIANAYVGMLLITYGMIIDYLDPIGAITRSLGLK